MVKVLIEWEPSAMRDLSETENTRLFALSRGSKPLYVGLACGDNDVAQEIEPDLGLVRC